MMSSTVLTSEDKTASPQKGINSTFQGHQVKEKGQAHEKSSDTGTKKEDMEGILEEGKDPKEVAGLIGLSKTKVRTQARRSKVSLKEGKGF